jgi:hypothetical protein
MFAVSTSYEAAFTIAPKEQKVRCEEDMDTGEIQLFS